MSTSSSMVVNTSQHEDDQDSQDYKPRDTPEEKARMYEYRMQRMKNNPDCPFAVTVEKEDTNLTAQPSKTKK